MFEQVNLFCYCYITLASWGSECNNAEHSSIFILQVSTGIQSSSGFNVVCILYDVHILAVLRTNQSLAQITVN